MALIDKFLPLTLEEVRNPKILLGWVYFKENKSRWIDTSYESGSIDFGIASPARFVYNDISYDIYREYIILEENVRLIVGAPVELVSENKALLDPPKS